MKQRNGFVSNSSSSSFIFLVKEDVHNKVVATMSKEDQRIIEALFDCKIMRKITAFDLQLIEYATYVDMGGGGTWDSFEEPEDYKGEDAYEVAEDYMNRVKQLEGSYFETEIGDGG